MDSAAHYLSKNVSFDICHDKNSKVTVVGKFKKFRVDTPLKHETEHAVITAVNTSNDMKIPKLCFERKLVMMLYLSSAPYYVKMQRLIK